MAVYRARLARPGACPDLAARVDRSDREGRCPGWAPEARLAPVVLAAPVVPVVPVVLVVLVVPGAASVLVPTVSALAVCPRSEPRPQLARRPVLPLGKPGPRAAWVLAGRLALEIQEIMLAPVLQVQVFPVLPMAFPAFPAFPGPAGCRAGGQPRLHRALPAS